MAVYNTFVYMNICNVLEPTYAEVCERKKTLVNGLLNLESYPFSFFLLQEIYSDYIFKKMIINFSKISFSPLSKAIFIF